MLPAAINSAPGPKTTHFGAKGGNQNHRLSHEPRNAKEAKTQAKATGQANTQKDRKGGDVRFGGALNQLA